MGLVEFIRNSFTLQNLAAAVICRIPGEISHNLEKLAAIRKAFAYTHLEGVYGDYLEFGVFEGTSLIGAMESHGALRENARCRFFGFDSFEGLRVVPACDQPHPLFANGEFSTSYGKVMRRLKRYQRRHEVRIIKGYFSETLSPAAFAEWNINKIRVSLIDCDLKSSALDVFISSFPYWQAGTVLVIDDFFNYRADPTAGVCGAFREFRKMHPEFVDRNYGSFGTGGIIKIVCSPPRQEEKPVISGLHRNVSR